MNENIEPRLPKPPKGYSIWQKEGRIYLAKSDSRGDECALRLTNSTFIKLAVDEAAPYIILCGEPLIDYLMQNQEATVIDLAGGYKSSAAAEIAAWFPGTRVFNIDLMATGRPGVRADASQLPVQDSCIDLVICMQFLMHAQEKDLSLIVSEVERVLKPGGYFFANYDFPTVKPQMLTRVDTLSTEKITVYGKPR